MSAKVTSIGLKGLEGYRVNVEVGTFVGNDSIKIVGLPDAAVKESKLRILAALRSLGYTLSGQNIIINLSPAEQKKSSPTFDLPIAVSVLLSLRELTITIPEETGFIGALSLDGLIQPFEGMLAAVLAAKKLGLRRLYLPFDEKLPYLQFPEMELIHVTSLKEAIAHLEGGWQPIIHQQPEQPEAEITYLDFAQIIGQCYAKYALETAAAGEHHVLITGPPGCGKSLLAECFPTILPALTRDAQLEMISLYQLRGYNIPAPKMPPFRNPHHSASAVSIIGGGTFPKPGEISLAHRGVLFLDEVAEFSKTTLEMLRQPLESGSVSISRTNASISYPASFIMLAAMNPCPCGYAGSNSHYCICTPRQIRTYQNKLSGPLRDRFDIQLFMKSEDFRSLKGKMGESSQTVRKRVYSARVRQYDRYGEEICNSRVPYEVLVKMSPLTNEQQRTLQQVSIKKNWSNRTYIKIIRLARTIADLHGAREITDQSIWEAIKLNTGVSGRRKSSLVL
ncbi:YifB family Mg chelatase-like AAA ATPase [Neobacillus cucumis]|uniref:YifB family Mg chelatase-like AAA ATPase n=1 Tax=Neobacillus cucumis TaxID=1740721 RepID=UPI0018E010A5|nr:YifB family Mg chelatase-like AAA ATPase [Neobacillus cucumis]MBI0577770.1 YifB family Mg chelatase-like AAA ATPase [Neobacillus cucumis]